MMYLVPMELHFLSICYFHIHFHLTPTVEVNEIHEKLEETVPQIAISDHNTSRIIIIKAKFIKSITSIFFNTMLLFPFFLVFFKNLNFDIL